MVMMIGFRQGHGRAHARNPMGREFLDRKREMSRQQPVELLRNRAAVGAESDQRAEDHIPGSAADAVKSNDFH